MRLTAFFIMSFVCAATLCAAGDIKLPAAKKTGGTPVLEAIDKRGSATQSDFPTLKASNQELATILWAATGKNRDGRKWTVPMGMGQPPYCTVYVVDETGGYRYDWESHALKQVATGDFRADLAMQPFAKQAPQMLVFVIDAELAVSTNPWAGEFGFVLIGAMSQNIYLAAEAVGVYGRFIYSVDRRKIAEKLKLNAHDQPICAMPIGKR